MTQETAENSGMGVIIYDANKRNALDTYKGTQDDMAAEHILNTQMIEVVDGIATQSSRQALEEAYRVDKREESYIPLSIARLNGENLIGILNSQHYEVDDPHVSATGQVAGSMRRDAANAAVDDIFAAAKESGASDDEVLSSGEQRTEMMEDMVRSLTERLLDKGMGGDERKELIAAIDKGITPELYREITEKHPTLLKALISSAQELNNDDLRNLLIRRAMRMLKEEQ